MPAVDARRAEIWVYAKNIRAGWARTHALMGHQRVTIATRDDSISALARQLHDLKMEVESVKQTRRSDLAAARTERNRLRRQLEAAKQLADESSGRRTGQLLANAREQISRLETDLEAAKEQADTVLRETRSQLRGERDEAVRQLVEAKEAARRAEASEASLRAWHNLDGRNRPRAGPAADSSSQSVYRCNARLVEDLRQFMDEKFEGGHEGEVARMAVVAYLKSKPGIASCVVSQLGLREQVQAEFISILKEHYNVENCAALFMHGNLTHAGYQAISNLMAGVWDSVDEKFVRLMAPDGKTPIPRMASLHVLLDYFKKCAEEFGVESLHEGQGGALNIQRVLQSQVEYLLKDAEPESIPQQIPVQFAADSAGWSKKPTDKIMKNFTALVVRPILGKAGRSDRVGDTVNSCHNNRLAALYAGSDSHHLMHKFLNTSNTSSGQMVLTLRQQMEQLAANSLHTSQGVIGVLWRLGGDLKFLVESMGISSNAATYPCHQCTCHKDHMWRLPEDFPLAEVPQPRTYQWMLKMAHAFGEEVGITEPYVCPGCNREISAEQRHQPVTREELRQYGLDNFSHVWGKLPLTAIEPEDAVPDGLHGFLRTAINMFFVGISMNLHSLERAEEVCQLMRELVQVEADPVFSQRSREATRKQVQSWNGKECWRVLASIGTIMDETFKGRAAGADATPAERQAEEGYNLVSSMFSSFVELMAAWMLDVSQEHWQQVAQLLREKAKKFRDAFVMAAGSTVDCTPTMHSILYHYPHMYARHGPIMRYSMQGLEAKHQPIKRARRGHCNQKSFTHLGRNNARGFTTVHSVSTDIMQVTRRMTARDYIMTIVPTGKGTKKRARSELQTDPLSAVIRQLQQDYQLDLQGGQA